MILLIIIVVVAVVVLYSIMANRIETLTITNQRLTRQVASDLIHRKSQIKQLRQILTHGPEDGLIPLLRFHVEDLEKM